MNVRFSRPDKTGNVVVWRTGNYAQRFATLSLALLLLLRTVPMLAQSGTNVPPNFDIGDITPQVIWHGATSDFFVRSDELGSGATFTFVANPPPVGAIVLDSVNGHFIYTPAAQDKEHFTVTIQASKTGLQPVSQDVGFDPMPHLQVEQDVFGLAPTHAMPDAASSDYIIRSEVLSNAPESFNYAMRQTRAVNISGKTVILEQGHANGLYDTYNEKDDIKTFNVYAETLIVRDALRLPQTTVTIYARELRFEDRPVPATNACINTTPRSLATLAAQFQHGQNGLNGGGISAQIQGFYSMPGPATRFVTDGGRGQPAGLGQPGAAGANAGPADCGGDTWCSGVRSASPPNTTLIIMHGWDPDPTTWGGLPGNGGNAISTNRSGSGGNAGYLFSNIDLGAYAQSQGGSAGSNTVTLGGAAGSPNPAYIAIAYDSHSPYEIDPYYSSPGTNASSLPGTNGASGSFSGVGHTLSWLSPSALRMVVAHARDSYVYGYSDAVKSSLEQYRDDLTNYQGRAEWNNLSEQWQLEFRQLQNEIIGMLYRLDSHLDYFGNPAGWVPMLSFEVNKLAFEGEIERAIKVLYLNYWVSHAASTLVQKSNALATARQKLKDEIDGYVSQYNANVQLFPVLATESVSVSNELRQAQVGLQQLEQHLIAQAQHIVDERHKPPSVPGWQKVARVAGAALSVFPGKDPLFGAIGRGLNLLASMDANDPWSTLSSDEFRSLGDEFTKTNLTLSVANWKAQMDRIDFHTIETNNLINNVKALYDLGRPIAEGVKAMQDKQKATEAPKSEVEAELKQLEAGSPQFQGFVSKVAELNVNLELLGRRISAALQDISSASEGITQNTLAIDALNRGLAQGNAIIDHRAMVYLAEMDKRARGRLLNYHYYMAKAYEYRLLQPYDGELNLQLLFDRFAQIVEAGSGHDLSASDFDALKAIYEEQLSTITADIFSIYNSNPPGLSAPLRFNFTAEQLEKLNAGQSITINLKEMGLFQPTEDNIRIVDLHVTSLSAHVQGPVPSLFGYVDVVMEHSGESKLSSGGHDYLFRHYNYLTANPITWMTRYDVLDAQIDRVGPSAANESMLAALLSREGIAQTTENLLLYSRPAAWADIVITKAVNTDNGSDIVLDDLRLELVYDFVPKSVNKAALEVLAPPNGLMPYIITDVADQNARQDGRGGFRRHFTKGQSVSLTAPQSYGSYKFVKWTDQHGTDIGTPSSDRHLHLTMNSSAMVRPNYRFEPYLYPSNGVAYPSGATNGTVQLTTGPGDVWSATSNVPWITFTTAASGTNGGMIDYLVAANADCTSRTGHVVLAGLNFSVTQAAGSGSYELSPSNAQFSNAGGAGTVNVLAGGGCPWTALKDVDWISFTSGTNGSGPGIINYAVATNSGPIWRVAIVTIAGKAHTLSQAGASGNSPKIGSLGVTSNMHFGFTFSGVIGKSNYNIEASTNLVNWSPVTNISATSPLIEFLDPLSADKQAKFFRILVP